jgi:nucleotide-binding universal stress UspA family protein
MKYLVGYSADQGGREALALGILLARASGGGLVVCTILPETWGHPSMARVDAEYAGFLEQHAGKTLEKARAQVGKLVPAELMSRSAPTVREGLFATANDVNADGLVLGSARSARFGNFMEGGVTAGVLHSAPLPVALATRGYAPGPRARLARITCAISATPESLWTARSAHQACARLQVPLRLLTFVVRDRQMYPTGAGYQAENMVANQLRAQAVAGQKAIIAALPPKPPVTAAIADGKTWKSAFGSVPWKEGEIVAVGSSTLGPLLRVFLGSNAAKILHHAPVPSLILPSHGSDDRALSSRRA